MIRNLILFLITFFLLLMGCQAIPEQKESKTEIQNIEPKVIDENTNIHFTGQFCSECHEQIPQKGGDSYLKYNGDYQLLCRRCHPGVSPGYCHPLNIISEQSKPLAVPAGFPLKQGKLTCNTCHDIYRQCQKRRFERFTLRGAPYPRKTDFCFICHDRGMYKELNAHHQIQSDGTLDEKMCLYCHGKKPDEQIATYQEVTFIGDTRLLCRRCHKIEGNHPGDFDHMAQPPSAKALKDMAAMETEFAIILPLAREGKMTCITCHNPHAKGVIAADKPSAKGADAKYRERLPGKLCIECHQM